MHAERRLQMPKPTFEQFKSAVEKMRDLQTEFFMLSSKAQKERKPQAYDAKKVCLQKSKEAELTVDSMIIELNRPEEKGDNHHVEN